MQRRWAGERAEKAGEEGRACPLNCGSSMNMLAIGSHIIRKPLIIPKGHNLVIKDGTEIFFNENSFIYINEGNLISLGDKNKINKFKALKDHWGGILVSNSSKSKIIHTSFENMDYYSDVFANIYLTGSINFFNSNINLNGVNFKNSIAEDMLNIVNSNFFLNEAEKPVAVDFLEQLKDEVKKEVEKEVEPTRAVDEIDEPKKDGLDIGSTVDLSVKRKSDDEPDQLGLDF